MGTFNFVNSIIVPSETPRRMRDRKTGGGRVASLTIWWELKKDRELIELEQIEKDPEA